MAQFSFWELLSEAEPIFFLIFCFNTQIVGGRKSKNVGLGLLFGTRRGGFPEERLTVLFIPQGSSNVLRVVLQEAMVSNQGTAFEKITQLTGCLPYEP